jgi:cell division septum initiation protein DivIVA
MADNTENTGADDTMPATGDLGDAGKKALDAERRDKRAAEKRATDLEAKLKEFEDRDKTESTRVIERAEAAEKRATDAESRALRLEIASEKGLTPAQAKRLVGDTREELEADASELLETFKPVTSTDDDTNVIDSLDLGNRTGSPQKGKTTADLFAAAIDGSFTR